MNSSLEKHIISEALTGTSITILQTNMENKEKDEELGKKIYGIQKNHYTLKGVEDYGAQRKILHSPLLYLTSTEHSSVPEM